MEQTKSSREVLEAGLDWVREASPTEGRLELIVRRPTEGEREPLPHGQLDLTEGLQGDRWVSSNPHPDAQVTVMNARSIALAAGPDPARWAQAGDQLYVDLDISEANLPPGTRLQVGAAVLEVTSVPHLGCGKFSRRFGVDAMKVFNSEQGRALRLRGLNTRVVTAGQIAVGDAVRKL